MIIDTVGTVLIYIKFLQVDCILIFQNIVVTDRGSAALERFIAGIPAFLLRIRQSLYDFLRRRSAVDTHIEEIVIPLIAGIGAGNQPGIALALLLIYPGRQMNRAQFPVFTDLKECLRISTPRRIIRQNPFHKSSVQKGLYCCLRMIGAVESQLFKLKYISFTQKIARIHMISDRRLCCIIPSALARARSTYPAFRSIACQVLDQALVAHLL